MYQLFEHIKQRIVVDRLAQVSVHALKHRVHIYLHKADDKTLASEPDVFNRHSDYHLFVLCSAVVLYSYLRLGYVLVVDVVFTDVVLRTERSVYRSVRVNKCELVKGVQLFILA